MQQPASVLLNRLLARGRFRHVQVLVRLAELGSVRRTAEAIGMTQPGVTQILADLEAMVEGPLFHRHARGVRPTPVGADLLPLARQLLVGVASTAEAAAQRRGIGEGVVRVFATTAAINGLLVQALPAFNDAHPATQVHLKESEIDDTLLAIARGEVDMACTRRPAVLPEGWGFHEHAPDRFVIVCAPGHPLAEKRQVGLAELQAQCWLPAPAGSIARQSFDALAQRFTREPAICNVVTRVPSATLALLRHRPMLTLVPYGVVRHFVEAGDLVVLKLKAANRLEAVEPLGTLMPLADAGAATLRLADYLERFARKRNAHVSR